MATPTISVQPARLNFIVQVGATLDRTITWYEDEAKTQPVNLAGHTARLQVRTLYGDALIHDLTTENGGLTLGGILGTIRFFIGETETEEQSADADYYYGMELYDAGGDVIPFLAGSFVYTEDQVDPVA